MESKTLAKIIGAAASLIDKTLRTELLNETHYYPAPAIYPFWHSNEFTMLIFSRNSKIVIMASKSKDGEIMANLLINFGYVVVRGSSSRGAERALIEMIRYARNGHSLAFAVDGPRGPYHVLKSGVIYAAQKSGLPVVPVCSARKKQSNNVKSVG